MLYIKQFVFGNIVISFNILVEMYVDGLYEFECGSVFGMVILFISIYCEILILKCYLFFIDLNVYLIVC